jgi:hypothetical protein
VDQSTACFVPIWHLRLNIVAEPCGCVQPCGWVWPGDICASYAYVPASGLLDEDMG